MLIQILQRNGILRKIVNLYPSSGNANQSLELTFILIARPKSLPVSKYPLLDPVQIKQCEMVGDVNMFLPDGLEGDAECEIMTACGSHGHLASS